MEPFPFDSKRLVVVLSGTRERLLLDLANSAPLHVIFKPLSGAVVQAQASRLFKADQQAVALPCPVLSLQSFPPSALVLPKRQVGILTKEAFLQGNDACGMCVHQLSCALDGKTRSFQAIGDKQKMNEITCDN